MQAASGGPDYSDGERCTSILFIRIVCLTLRMIKLTSAHIHADNETKHYARAHHRNELFSI